MKKIILLILIFCLAVGSWFVYSEIYTAEAQEVDVVQFEIKEGETVGVLADRLEQNQVIRQAWLFKKYLVWQGVDKKIKAGQFKVERPITLSRVVESLSQPGVGETKITLIPGWTIRDWAQYLEGRAMFQAEETTELIGLPAVNYKVETSAPVSVDEFGDLKILKDKPWYLSYEGYLAPETYRIYVDATVKEIIEKLLKQREKQITEKMWADISKSGRSFQEILTMASILEKEVQTENDKVKVADIFWRRYDMNWALQADSTVHYAVGKSGDVFTTKEDRDSTSPWNTYKYPGLPLGPICNPSLESIEAAIYPSKNDYWYFITTLEGEVKYAKTLEEHNVNVSKYLR